MLCTSYVTCWRTPSPSPGVGQLPSAPPIDVPVEHPQSAEHGDFASSLPLRLARSLRMNPLEIANRLVPLIPASDALARVWVEPPAS